MADKLRFGSSLEQRKGRPPLCGEPSPVLPVGCETYTGPRWPDFPRFGEEWADGGLATCRGVELGVWAEEAADFRRLSSRLLKKTPLIT